jgi:hypothetical protein
MSDLSERNGDKGPSRPSNEAGRSGERDKVSQRGLEAEQLAALIDGNLDPAARSALVARVASSDEYSAVLADALAAFADIRDDEPVSINSCLVYTTDAADD